MSEIASTEAAKLLRLDQAARRLNIGVTTLRGLIAAGEIPSVKIGTKMRLVATEDVDAYADSLPRETGITRESRPTESETPTKAGPSAAGRRTGTTRKGRSR